MVVTITSTFSFFCVGTFHGRVTGRNKHEFLPFSVYRSQSITNLYSPKTWLQETLGAPYKLRHINRPLPEDHLNQLVLMISHVTSILAVDPIGQCLTGSSQKIRRTCLSFGTSHSEVELLTSLSWVDRYKCVQIPPLSRDHGPPLSLLGLHGAVSGQHHKNVSQTPRT